MSYAITSFPHVAAPSMPRGSRWAAAVFTALASLFRAPAPRKLSRAEEAAAVREMARRVQDTDPGFASDLYAAAIRHESLDDL